MSRWVKALIALGVVGSAMIVMVEIDSLLRTLELPSAPAYGMSALQGPRFDVTVSRLAVDYWNDAAAGSYTHPNRLIYIHALCDVVFAVAVYYLLWRALRRYYPGWVPWAAVVAFAADLIEDTLMVWLAWRSSTPISVALTIASWVKWLAVIVAVTAIAWALLEWLPRPWQLRWWRVLWTFRVQVAVVAILGLVVALPSRDRLGAVAQLPDVLRSYTGDVWAYRVPLAALAIALLTTAVAITGRWLRFAPATTGSADIPDTPARVARREWLWIAILVAGIVTMLSGIVIAVFRQDTRWLPSPKVLIAIAAVLLTAAIIHLATGRRQDRNPAPDWTSGQHEQVLNCLTALVVTFVGLGFVRAFCVPVLLTEYRTGLAIVLLVLGFLGAAVAAPALYALLTEHHIRPARIEGVSQTRTVTWWTLSGVLIGVAVLAAIALAIWPRALGSRIGTDATLATALYAGCVGLGGVTALAQRAAPMTRVRQQQTLRPVALPAMTSIVAVGIMVGSTVGNDSYHDVRTFTRDASAGTVSLETSFDIWQEAAQRCAPLSQPARRVQPMLFVAAAGGGIRAAYWTERVLRQLTAATSATSPECAQTSIFLVSSVSGGSLGTALWSRHVDEPADQTDATRFADDGGLAAAGATWLFRDLPRALAGINPIGYDRAAVLEDDWIADAPVLGEPFLNGDAAKKGDPWQSIVMLNASDLLSRCRVVVTRLQGPPAAAQHCDDPHRAAAEATGAFYASQLGGEDICAGPANMTVASAVLLSSRFPFVTPTGNLYSCLSKADNRKLQLQVGDGGYLESSGQLTALQVWRSVRDLIAEHNTGATQGTLAGKPLADTLIMPIFVSIGNGYRSVAGSAPRTRTQETIAPLTGAFLKAANTAAKRLEIEARAEFGKPLPGTHTRVGGCLDNVVIAAPGSRPELTAPLGWALSVDARKSLDKQLADWARGEQFGCLKPFLTGTVTVGNDTLPHP